jgi:hypothetical protein
MNDESVDSVVSVRIRHLDAVFSGLGTGLVAGLGLFVATNWLVLKGGEVVGPHLALLGQFLPGYEVTFVGSVIGIAFGLVLGVAGRYLGSALFIHTARGQNPRVASAGAPRPPASSESRQA